MPNQDPLLSRDEFEREQNNFYLHFAGEKTLAGQKYRSQRAYQMCCRNSDIFMDSAETLIDKNIQSSGPHLDDLYFLYTLMHPYAESNQELFK